MKNYAPIIQREPSCVQRPRPASAWIPLGRSCAAGEPWSGPAIPAWWRLPGKSRWSVDVGPDAKPAFILYLPIYTRGQPHDSVAERRAHLAGWVFASFRSPRASSQASTAINLPGLALAIYDGVEPSTGALLYRSPVSDRRAASAAFISANEYLVVGGHNWTLR